MTNEITSRLQKIGKVLLILLLLFIATGVFNTFIMFSNLEKKMSSPDFDYTEPVATIEKKELAANNTIVDKNIFITGDGTNYNLGSPNPKVTIVEFADFACPYCKKSFSKIREISLLYNKDVKYIFRDLPIVKDYSLSLALAARCAGEQGLFWLMHDRLFMNQGVKDKAGILEVAKQSGVQLEKFESCLDSQKYSTQINKDFSDAKNLGIETIGTPVWFINGYQVAGDIPEDTFIKIIEDIINNS